MEEAMNQEIYTRSMLDDQPKAPQVQRLLDRYIIAPFSGYKGPGIPLGKLAPYLKNILR